MEAMLGITTDVDVFKMVKPHNCHAWMIASSYFCF